MAIAFGSNQVRPEEISAANMLRVQPCLSKCGSDCRATPSAASGLHSSSCLSMASR